MKVELGPDFATTVDFMVDEGTAAWHVEEVKGAEDKRFKIVKRLWKKYGPCPMHVIVKGATAYIIEGAK